MRRRRVLGLLATGLGTGAGCVGRLPVTGDRSGDGPRTIYVDAEAGGLGADGSRESPLHTIGAALDVAGPGDTVRVASGEYVERIEPPNGGEPGEPITITGPPDAVIRSDPAEYNVVLIRESHVHLRGLSIDGLENPDAPGDVDSYSRAQLVQLRPPKHVDRYLRDVVIAPHRIGNTMKSLVSVERSRNVEVGPFRVIGPAGAGYLYTDEAGHNGEIVYVGTSPSNLGTDWHPWTEYDRTADVHVHHVDNSAGHPHSELVNTKLGTHDVTVEYCTDGGGSQNTEDYPAASVRLQSYGATVRWCDLRDGGGFGVEVASHTAHDAQERKSAEELTEAERRGGTDNAIYGNRVTGFEEGAFDFPDADLGQDSAAQRLFCGNQYDGETDGEPGVPCPGSVPEGEGTGHTGGDGPWS